MLARCERCADGVGKGSNPTGCGGGGRFGSAVGLVTLAACSAQSGFLAQSDHQAGMPLQRGGHGWRAARWCRLGFSADVVEGAETGRAGARWSAHKNPGGAPPSPSPAPSTPPTWCSPAPIRGRKFDAVTDEPISGFADLQSDFAAADPDGRGAPRHTGRGSRASRSRAW